MNTPHNNFTETTDHIDHTAVVRDVDVAHNQVTVRLTDDGECSQCPAARLCSVSSSANKSFRDITVGSVLASRLKPGDDILLRGTEQMHHRAIMLATVVPCILLIMIMSVIWFVTGSQLWAALGGIGSMLVFFLILYLIRNRVAHEFKFTLHLRP